MTSKERKEHTSLYQIKDSQFKKVTRERHGHYIIFKGTIHQEDIPLINIYLANEGAPK